MKEVQGADIFYDTDLESNSDQNNHLPKRGSYHVKDDGPCDACTKSH